MKIFYMCEECTKLFETEKEAVMCEEKHKAQHRKELERDERFKAIMESIKSWESEYGVSFSATTRPSESKHDYKTKVDSKDFIKFLKETGMDSLFGP